VRVVACIVILALCLGSAGCRMFGKKPAGSASSGDHAAAPAPRSDSVADRSASDPAVSGLLAGRIIDSYNLNPPGATFIQVVNLKETQETAAAAPIDVAADSQGYFTIQGLQPGQQYKLVARTKDGDRKWAGIAYATPPDAKVVIRISEDLVSAAIPPVPPEPAWPGAKPPAIGSGTQPGKPGAILERPSIAKPGAGWSPTPESGAARGPADAGSPPPVTVTHPENMVQGEQRASLPQQPATIRNPFGPWPGPTASEGPRVPTCQFRGQTLDTFTLADLNGQPWDFRRNHHGRLILLDFWGTWCPHCVASIPKLIDLQTRYGAFGLDVVGIAYETEGTPQEQSQRLMGFRDRNGINYRLLVGSDMKTCPVKTQFGVDQFPTLVLLDDQGQILWRAEGLNENNRRQLESQIGWQLNVRK
jgi:thiol-disulfide isomerase/thioredoxin